MNPEVTKKLISDTQQKKKDTPQPETFLESVKPPPLTIPTADILKPKADFPLTTWVFEPPPMTEAKWKKVQPQIPDILAFTQTLGYLYCFHPKDTQLQLETITKHYLWNTAIPFVSKVL